MSARVKHQFVIRLGRTLALLVGLGLGLGFIGLLAWPVAAELQSDAIVPAPDGSDSVTLESTVDQLLKFVGGLSPTTLRMIEEEGYLCTLEWQPLPPAIVWVCSLPEVPPVVQQPARRPRRRR